MTTTIARPGQRRNSTNAAARRTASSAPSPARRAAVRAGTKRHQPSRAKPSSSRIAAVDAYIEKSQPFAKPILKRLREIVHRACPQVQEAIKWGMPAFEYKGPLAGMAGFKQHCTFGFWKDKVLRDRQGILETHERTAMGNLGCIRSLSDLPSSTALARLCKEAANLNDAGIKAPRTVRERKPIPMPPDFAKELRGKARALAYFDRLPPSHKREYLEWIVEAKKPETRAKRIATAITWLSQGKHRNWKYETKR